MSSAMPLGFDIQANGAWHLVPRSRSLIHESADDWPARRFYPKTSEHAGTVADSCDTASTPDIQATRASAECHRHNHNQAECLAFTVLSCPLISVRKGTLFLSVTCFQQLEEQWPSPGSTQPPPYMARPCGELSRETFHRTVRLGT